MEKIKLPPGATVYAGGQKYEDGIPADICPKKFLPVKSPTPAKAKPTDG